MAFPSLRLLRWAAAAALLALVPAAVGPAAAAPGRSNLASRVEARLRKASVRPARRGVVVLERGSGKTLLATGPENSLVPASTAKVLTAAAALDLLGPGYEFVTRVTARGTLSGDTLNGDLVLHAGADPLLGVGTSRTEILGTFRRFARAAAEAGIRRVDGALVVDDGPIDREHVHPTWTREDLTRRYGAGVGGATFHHGSIRVEITGGRAGRPARLDAVTTTGIWRLKNDVATVAGRKAALGGHWLDDGRTLLVRGRIGAGASSAVEIPVPDPCLFAGGALLTVLREAGVEVDGVRLARDEADRAAGRALAEHRTPLGEALVPLLRDSQNQVASLVFKACGAAAFGRGTWETGEAAIHRVLRRRDVPIGSIRDAAGEVAAATRILDGSGLSTSNRVTAATLAGLLASFDQDLLRGPTLFAAMPVSGKSGTLRRRLKARGLAGRVHAKTGTLNDVRTRALAGYLEGRGGRPGRVFAIVLNGGAITSTVVDDLVREIAR